ncbi:hypothetical protein SAMN05421805_11854 [Saccharopolyspora antimicrobica]|uniref:Uncharacterized protein n=1 Tax=Saccharopolyspora antimicrobica TaxID=455193 RepID=A0A1I5IC82_9PSEU|nr:hypothetical protein ATL45_3891 [Saccharopolyspora antimicrobica]SFO58102.1 hypothetical protein SAMN05421805_11854 [Saccharopolyspora antimicrobica]
MRENRWRSAQDCPRNNRRHYSTNVANDDSNCARWSSGVRAAAYCRTMAPRLKASVPNRAANRVAADSSAKDSTDTTSVVITRAAQRRPAEH